MKKFHNINGPYVRSSNSTDKIMIHLFISLLPIIIFSFYNNCGRWFSSRACPYDEVETFTRKVEYWEN